MSAAFAFNLVTATTYKAPSRIWKNEELPICLIGLREPPCFELITCVRKAEATFRLKGYESGGHEMVLTGRYRVEMF